MAANSAALRRFTLIALALAVLLGGQTFGEYLVRATGGSNVPAPYTSLAYATPEQAAGGLEVGGAVTFVITNATGEDRVYRWYATVDGRPSTRGSIATTVSNPRVAVTVPLPRSGDLVFGVDGLPQELTGTILPHTPTGKARS